MDIRQMKILDSKIGFLAVLLLPVPVRKTSTPKINSVLIIRPGGIGDAVLLIPAVNALKKKFPDIQIAVLAEKRNASAFKLCPSVDEVLHYDKPKELLKALRGNYDVAIDTEQWHRLSAVVARLTRAPVSIGYATNERKKLFTHPVSYSQDDYEADSFLNLLAPLGIEGTDGIMTPFLIVPETSRIKAGTLLESLECRPFVTIFPGASIPERRWGTDKFAAVAQRLSAKGIAIVVVGGKVEETVGDRIVDGRCGLNLAGRASLMETAAIIERSSVLLSGDSGVLHMGVGLGRPTVSLFGPGIAKKWAPRGHRHIVFNIKLPCSPCTKFGYTPKCPINAGCMAGITIAEVVAAVEKLLMENQERGKAVR
jgi:lipopolysaccharide heptosyltransferase II